jgi:hypothetical protein
MQTTMKEEKNMCMPKYKKLMTKNVPSKITTT